MQNTPPGCGSHLPSIRRAFKNHPKSRSVNICFQCSDFDPNIIFCCLTARTPARQAYLRSEEKKSLSDSGNEELPEGELELLVEAKGVGRSSSEAMDDDEV
jgi:hypothetical protein